MPYDEDTLNTLHDTPMTGRSQTMASDGTIYAIDAIRGLREIVAELGPDTTRNCQYAEYPEGDTMQKHPTAPHCIVGVFLHKRGVDLETLASLEGDSVMGVMGDADVREHVNLNEQAVEVLWAAQTIQDDSFTWGQALETAEAVFEAQKVGSRYVHNAVIQEERVKFQARRITEVPESDVNDTTGYGDPDYDPFND